MPFWSLSKLFPGSDDTDQPTTPTTPTTRRKRVRFSQDRQRSRSRSPAPKRRRNFEPLPEPEISTEPDIPKVLQNKDAPERWDLTISPRSRRFWAVVKAFRKLLRDVDIQNILEVFFPAHEIALLSPRPRLPGTELESSHLQELREENTWRYNQLLASPRFRKEARNADIGFKLAMAWFGLPVAPISGGKIGELENEKRPLKGEVITDGVGDEMRFLNGYTTRSYSTDAGARGKFPCGKRNISAKWITDDLSRSRYRPGQLLPTERQGKDGAARGFDSGAQPSGRRCGSRRLRSRGVIR